MSTVAGKDRRPSNRLFTLAIASIASAAAAIFTSKVWNGGVIGTAAATPVVVALTEDSLRQLARRLAGRRASAAEPEDADAAEPEDADPAERRGRTRGSSILGALAIGIMAFVLAALALTIPEAVAGRSITGSSDRTTFFGMNENKPWGPELELNQCFDSLDALKGCINDLLERE